MRSGVAICEEFCSKVTGYRGREGEPSGLVVFLKRLYFTELMTRMVQAGYCCTEVKTSTENVNAKFERSSEDEG